ncbi:MAG: hypothetical protein AAFQ36_09405 [Pseudomonadota bacterium]
MRALIYSAAVALTALPATAQSICAPREAMLNTVVTQLERERYFEALSPAGIVEVFAGDDGKWVMTATAPNGISCVLVAGEAWSAIPLAHGEPS